MPAPSDASVKTMTEYHQRYSKGRLIHLGWEAYCRDCGRVVKLPSNVITHGAARRRLLDMGWLPEKIDGYEYERWLCPTCHSPFTRKEATDVD